MSAAPNLRMLFLALSVALAAQPAAAQSHPLAAEPQPRPPLHVLSKIPPRPKHALTGSAFLKATAKLSLKEREARILAELLKGNIPTFVRTLVPVPVYARTEKRFPTYRGTIWVAPDYLAVGDDHDYIRVPMDPVTAQKVADRFGAVLPTKAIVDAVYEAARVRLEPKPLPPTRSMRNNTYLGKAEAMIEAQLKGLSDFKRGQLVAGDKKDLVVTNRLLNHPKRVAIYGWHTEPGEPIQPLSIWHKKSYADYSHGLRLVEATMTVEGTPYAVTEVMRHADFWPLVSEEGPMRYTRIIDEGVEWTKEELRHPPY